jgi:hypothetical protein
MHADVGEDISTSRGVFSAMFGKVGQVANLLRDSWSALVELVHDRVLRNTDQPCEHEFARLKVALKNPEGRVYSER